MEANERPHARVPLTRSRKLLFASVTICLFTFLPLAGLLAADSYAHARLERSAGLNRWGYRGEVLARKSAGEQRVIVLGGSTAFGYGVTSEESMPAALARLLREQRAHDSTGPISVANLAYNNEGAYATGITLQDFAFLRADVAVLHDGYNDLKGLNLHVERHASPVFRLTGYMPILPVFIREKAMMLRNGSLGDAYLGRQNVFKPSLAGETAAAALEAAYRLNQSLGGQMQRAMPPLAMDDPSAMPAIVPHDQSLMCGTNWGVFCQMVANNIDYALSHGMRVVVIGQPLLSASIHSEQQAAMAAMIMARYRDNPAVHYLDLRNAINLLDPSLAFDGMHLTAHGNALVAKALVEPILDVLEVPAKTINR